MNYTEYIKDQDFSFSAEVENMNNIKKDLCNFFWGNYPEQRMNEITIIPCDEPLIGLKGFMLFKEEFGKELSVNVQIKSSVEATKIVYTNREAFNNAFEKAWDSEKPLYIYDDPILILCGFIVESRKGREWHYIKLIDYKE